MAGPQFKPKCPIKFVDLLWCIRTLCATSFFGGRSPQLIKMACRKNNSLFTSVSIKSVSNNNKHRESCKPQHLTALEAFISKEDLGGSTRNRSFLTVSFWWLCAEVCPTLEMHLMRPWLDSITVTAISLDCQTKCLKHGISLHTCAAQKRSTKNAMSDPPPDDPGHIKKSPRHPEGSPSEPSRVNTRTPSDMMLWRSFGTQRTVVTLVIVVLWHPSRPPWAVLKMTNTSKVTRNPRHQPHWEASEEPKTMPRGRGLAKTTV